MTGGIKLSKLKHNANCESSCTLALEQRVSPVWQDMSYDLRRAHYPVLRSYQAKALVFVSFYSMFVICSATHNSKHVDHLLNSKHPSCSS